MKSPSRAWLWSAAAAVAALLLAAGLVLYSRRTPAPKSAPPATALASAPASVPATQPDQKQTVSVPPRSNFVLACAPLHLAANMLQDLIQAARPVYNLARVQAGNTITLVSSAAGVPRALSYQIDLNHTLWLRAQPDPGKAGQPTWAASIETLPFVTKVVGISGTVQSSLFQAVEDAGEQDPLAIDIAGIFGWDLDFYTDPRVGDVFRVMVEKKYLNGKFAGYGQIVAAEYVNDGHKFDAVRFHDSDGILAYYRPDGQPLKRAFLRSPLKFAARITSGFSRHRFHPILKVYRAHLGIDFAAPTGTPVQTIGSGVVTRAGRFGGDGNMVQIRHTGGYQTLYLHLSRILVHVGERVEQGERIGLVGMTGLATGPHLDFRIEHNGVFEDFEQVRKTLPPADPVSPALMPQFHNLEAQLMPQLSQLQPATAVASMPH